MTKKYKKHHFILEIELMFEYNKIIERVFGKRLGISFRIYEYNVVRINYISVKRRD